MIHDLFHAAADTHPAKTAVVGHQTRLTYGQLRREALRLAHELRRQGTVPGDRVAVLLPNSTEAAIAIWAALEVGAVLVPLHAASRPDALAPILQSAEPQSLLTAQELSTLVRTTQQKSMLGKVWMIGATAVAPESHWIPWPAFSGPTVDQMPRLAQLSDDALAALVFTSGSTGEPKGVMLSHANMSAAVRAVNEYLRLTSGDVMYSALPLSSSYGLYQLVSGLALGATVVLDRTFSFPAKSLELIANERATVFAGVPTMFAWLANTPLLDQFDLSHLRILTSAAAALPVEHGKRVRERLPYARLFVMYGQTECKRISYLEPDDFDRKPGSVGRGMPFQELAVVNEAGQPVNADETGELIVKGPHVMQGYWRDPEATAYKLRALTDRGERWLHTDDLFRVDAEGYLYFVGRRDDILKIGGNKVSPREIEEVLCQMPEILEAAVVGMPDALWGEAARAHVVLKHGAQCNAEDVIRFCTSRLRGFMVPKSVAIEKFLPKTESGKIKKRELS